MPIISQWSHYLSIIEEETQEQSLEYLEIWYVVELGVEIRMSLFKTQNPKLCAILEKNHWFWK